MTEKEELEWLRKMKVQLEDHIISLDAELKHLQKQWDHHFRLHALLRGVSSRSKYRTVVIDITKQQKESAPEDASDEDEEDQC